MSIKYGANGLHDGTDETKQLAFDVTGVTTGTTRAVTVPNANVDLPEINITKLFSDKQYSFPEQLNGTLWN